MLYGDEADALGTSWMCLNWMSQHSPKPSSPSMSRFLVTLFEKERYVMSATNCNVTLQAVLKLVVQSFNTWSSQKIGGYYGVVSTIKGDWKWLRQSLNLTRHYNTDCVCFKCMASKSLRHPYTDLSGTASWRGTYGLQPPWSESEPPELLHLHNFNVNMVGVDILHTFHLGLARDVIASLMVILLRLPNFFEGRTIQERIQNASRQAKDFACNVAHRAFPRKWNFTKARLNLGKRNNYAEFHGNAWMAGILLQWLNACFASKGAPSDLAMTCTQSWRFRIASFHCCSEHVNKAYTLQSSKPIRSWSWARHGCRCTCDCTRMTRWSACTRTAFLILDPNCTCSTSCA